MSLKLSCAARVELVMNLLKPPIYDDDGKVIGYSEPLISEEEGRKLLGFKDTKESAEGIKPKETSETL